MTLQAKLLQWFGRLFFPRYGPGLFCGNAASHIADYAALWCVGTGLDFGGGRWPLRGSMLIDRDTTTTLESLPPASQDYVFSSHCLEHIPGWRYVLKQFERVLRPGGVLVLYLPHEDMILWNPETFWGRLAGHVWQPRLETLVGYAALNSWRVLEYTAVPDGYYSWSIVLSRKAKQ